MNDGMDESSFTKVRAVPSVILNKEVQLISDKTFPGLSLNSQTEQRDFVSHGNFYYC